MDDRNKRSDPSLKVSDFASQRTIIYNLNKNNNARRQNKISNSKAPKESLLVEQAGIFH